MLYAKGRSSSSGQSGGKVESVARVVLLRARRKGGGSFSHPTQLEAEDSRGPVWLVR